MSNPSDQQKDTVNLTTFKVSQSGHEDSSSMTTPLLAHDAYVMVDDVDAPKELNNSTKMTESLPENKLRGTGSK